VSGGSHFPESHPLRHYACTPARGAARGNLSKVTERRALVTFQDRAWIGEHDGYAVVTSAQLWVDKGKALTPETLGGRKADYAEIPVLFYEITVDSIVEDRVGLSYRNLVIKNPGGGLNLSAPRQGKFIRRPGESVQLGTPVLDAGASLTLTLDEIR
jgi:hypothetical protein